MGNVAASSIGGCCAGGIVGDNYLGTISNCYNIGRVTAPLYTASAGGIAGQFDDTYGCMENCYTIQDETYCVQGTALTVDQMKQRESFEGFDFSKVWELDAASIYPFPVLQSAPHVIRAEDTVHFAGGNGTRFAPYRVSTAQHLDYVRERPHDTFVQTADIDLTAETAQNGDFYHDGSGWIPIGAEEMFPFSGWYDGGGHCVIGLKSQTGGLFGYNIGIIQNLGSVGGTVTSHPAAYGETYAGGIAGYNSGIICNCYHTGKIGDDAFSHTYAGGIAGYHEGVLDGCYNTGAVTGGFAGGIVGGGGMNGMLRNCYNTGRITAGPGYVSVCAGGIAGEIQSVSHCYNAGDIIANGDGAFAGGITGKSYGSVRDCYNAGDVTAVSQYDISTVYAGGLVGDAGSDVLCGYNMGAVSAKGREWYAGQIAGSAGLSNLRYVYYIGTGDELAVGDQDAGIGRIMVRTAEQMRKEAGLTGLDFHTIWAFDANLNEGFPILRGVGNSLPSAPQESIAKSVDRVTFDSGRQRYQFAAWLNNVTTDRIVATVFAAAYDENGKMMGLSVYDKTVIAAGGSTALPVEIAVPQMAVCIKLFCMDRETLVPFGQALYV